MGSRIFESGNAQQMTKLSKYVFLSLNHFNGTYDARIRRETWSLKNVNLKFVLPCLLFVIKPIFATSGFPTPGWVTAIGAVFVIVVMVAAAGAGIIREVMTHLLITISKIGLKATFTSAFWQSSYEINMVKMTTKYVESPNFYSSLFFTNFTKSLLLNGYGQFFYNFIKGNCFC